MSIFDYLQGPFAFGKFLDKSTGEKENSKYIMDDSGCRIANVPYDEYIYAASIPQGAVIPNGISRNNTAEENGKAIQAAIDCLDKNGGTVYIPEGTYLTNTIHLKSNTTLFVSKNAQLISICCDDNKKSLYPLYKGVICAENAENITITGGGLINGNGLTYTNEPEESEPLYALKKFNTYLRTIEARKRIHFAKDTDRSHILYFKNCKNINLENIILRDSAFWTIRFDNCFDVNIENFIIDSHMHIANSDGIDICGGKNYRINHSFIACADDAICIKSPEYPTDNVNISDCVLSSCANCFKIGTETQYDISNISMNSCYLFIPDGMTFGYSGIAIESCDGANVSNVNISDIKMSGVSSPLLIWLGNRLKYDKKDVGSIKDITIKNIEADRIEMPCAVVGCIDSNITHYVQNVRINNLYAIYRDTDEQLNIRKKIGEDSMNGYPDITRVSHIYWRSHELSKYWDLPCYGICIRHTENMDYENIKIQPRSCNKRKEFYIDDVK